MRVDAAAIELLAVRSAPDGTLLVFGIAPPVGEPELGRFAVSGEVSGIEVVDGPRDDLAFPLHADVLAGYFTARAADGETWT